jgi:hypothetical protein
LFSIRIFDPLPVSIRMRKPVASAAAIKEAEALVHAPARLVCMALGLSILLLAVRIASVW